MKLMPAARLYATPTFGWLKDDTIRWPKGWGWLAALTLSLAMWIGIFRLIFG
jgi:hypothetical protein